MANITKEQRETLALIDAIMAMFEQRDNATELKITASLNPFEFLFKIIEKYASYEDLLKWLVDFLTVSLPVVELSVKGVILSNLKGLIDCNNDPRIPNMLRKPLYNKNFEDYGFLFNLRNFDYTRMLEISPITLNGSNFYFGTRKYYYIDTDNKELVGKKFYFFDKVLNACLENGISVLNIKTDSEISNINELARAKDMNAFLWYVSHRGVITNKHTLDYPINQYEVKYTIKGDDGDDVEIVKTPLRNCGSKNFLSKVDGEIKLTTNFKAPPFLNGETLTTNNSNLYSLCISSFTENQVEQKVDLPYYGEGNEDYLMKDLLVTAKAPRDCKFTIVPYSDDNESVNWYVNSKSYYDFLKPENEREPRDLTKEYAICNFKYLNGGLKFSILPKPFVHIPTEDEPIWRIKRILFNENGEEDSKGKYSCLLVDSNPKPSLEYECVNGFTLKINKEDGSYQLIGNGDLSTVLYECYPKLTVYEFNYDYLMSQQLFDPTVVASRLMTSLITMKYNNSIGLTFDGISKTETAYQMRISEIVKNIVESTAYEVSDCFYTFSNDRYNEMLNDAELKRSQQYPFNDNGLSTSTPNASDFSEILNEYRDNASLQENVDVFTRAFNKVTADITKEVLPTDKYKINFNIITEALKTLTSILVESLITPKVILLFEINRRMIGNEGEIVDIEDLLKSLNGLIVAIVKELRDLILQELINFVMKFLLELLSVIKDEIIKEQLEYYRKLMKLLWEACAFKASHRKNLDSELDHVDYADIDEIEKPLEDNC